jgi:glyoxylase-like metal-dependent hydrolase (beta-lactamase superfamily II)
MKRKSGNCRLWHRKLVCLAALLGTVAFGTVAMAKAPHVSRLRLYVMDCGTIVPMDPTLYGLKAEEIHGDTGFVTPCYLIVHPKGTLAWDVGQVPDKDIPDDGTMVQQTVLRATRRLSTQLLAIGYQPQDITYLAMSHYHADHTANANAFAKSTWIVQQADYDMMFRPGDIPIRAPDTYKDLKDAKLIMLHNEDHDVFGDGTVIIKTAPGHTPGHQMLFLRLKKFGPLLLAGDLYHLPEERTLDRVPTFDYNADMTRATRKKVEEFLATTHATMWIQHNPATNATLKKSPEYYE